MNQSTAGDEMDMLHREIDRAFDDFVPMEPFLRKAFLPGRLTQFQLKATGITPAAAAISKSAT